MAGDRLAIPIPAAQSVHGRMRVPRTYGPGHYMLRIDSLRHRWRKLLLLLPYLPFGIITHGVCVGLLVR